MIAPSMMTAYRRHPINNLSFPTLLQGQCHREGPKQGQGLAWPHTLPYLLVWVLGPAYGGQSLFPCVLDAAVVPGSSS